MNTPNANNSSQEVESYQSIEELIYSLIVPYDNLTNFNIKEAIEGFNALSVK